jgi:hypothetical protein
VTVLLVAGLLIAGHSFGFFRCFRVHAGLRRQSSTAYTRMISPSTK